MKVDILQRDEIARIDPAQWRRLAQDSRYVNPFYEPWCLLPAIRHLDKNKEVLVVTAYEGDNLVALFPIVMKRSVLASRHLAIWKHAHCFLSDPLCLASADLGEIIETAARMLAATVVEIRRHSQVPPLLGAARPSVVFRTSRGAVLDTANVQRHLDALPRRRRAENRRITRRLMERGDVAYLTSRVEDGIDWLETYCALEYAGWKGRRRASILSSPGVNAYYRELDAAAAAEGRIEYQGLFAGAVPLALSFRILTRDNAFELKTSYNEVFGRSHPGVVLELLNLQALGASGFALVDSCANADNYLVNRLWPDRRELYHSFYFRDSNSGRLLRSVVEMAYRIKSRFSDNR